MTTATIDPPPRSVQQCMEALEQANKVRMARARVKQELASKPRKDSVLALIDIVREPEPELAMMRLTDLLGAGRHFGQERVRRILLLAGVSASKRVCGLSARQREALEGALREQYDLASGKRRR